MSNISAGLVGVTGYTGMELARLLAGHPSITLVRATSRAEAGRKIRDLYPHLVGLPAADLEISMPDPDDLADACDIVFLGVPHGAAMETAAQLRERGKKVVDLSADFRIESRDVYEEWYKVDHTRPNLLNEAVYGLPELYEDKIKDAELVANPGCYPTSVILGLAPALAGNMIETSDIVADSKSGASGSGRKPSVGSLFCEVTDNFRAYNLGRHRHTPEIEQEVSKLAGTDMKISFNTHLLPIDRGILSTMYTRLKPEADPKKIHGAYLKFYENAPWVRVLEPGDLPETRRVRGTMFCDIGLVHDPRTERLLIISTIDNLCRGASGQALANANLMLGLDITEGLNLAPLMP